MALIQLNWQPKAGSSQPLYQQIVHYFEYEITSGNWSVGDRLPPQRQLATELKVNRSTIVTALEELIAVGLITSKPGSGMQISGNHWSSLIAANTNWNDYVTAGHFQPNSEIIQAINHYEQTDVIRLSTGEPAPTDFPKDLFQRAMHRVSQQLTGLNYLEPTGIYALRAAIADDLATKGLKVEPANIIISAGSLQALQLVSLSLLPAQAVVYTEAPSYVKSLRVFQSAQVQLKGLTMDNQGLAYWHIPTKSEKRQQIIYSIPTFNNPTGIVMSQERRQQLLDFAQKHQMPILEDTAYQDLWFKQTPPPPLKALDQTGNVIYFGSISKSLAPGMRIGWTVAAKPVIDRLSDVKMQTDYGASSLSQLVLTEILTDSEYPVYQAKFRQILATRAQQAEQVLTHYWHDFATWQTPTGGFYLWVRLAKPINIKKLFKLALADKVLFNPGSIYDFQANQFIRLSFAFESPSRFEEGIVRLTKIIQREWPAIN